MKVSFDFDDTLDREDVQHIARQILTGTDIDVWVVTARLPDKKAPLDNWNEDLWFVCQNLGIPKSNVIFTSYSSKHEFFWEKHFLFHLDDDPEELRMIEAMTDTIAINSLEPTWKKQILKLIK